MKILRLPASLITLWVITSTVPLFSQPVNFADFTDISPLTLNGAAATLGNPVAFNGANVLRLTDGLGQSSSLFLTQAISLANGASFSTAFTFQMTDGEGIGSPPGADGIVFAVQTVSNTAGGGGGGIGYEGINNSVGIEFDTFDNSGWDPDGNHVGVNLNGDVDSVKTVSVATVLNAGDIWYAWVDYNGATDLLEVRLAMTPTRPASPLMTHVVDLTSVLGQTDAFIGFTSGTGAGANDHDIRSWRFVPDYSPLDDPNFSNVTSVPTLSTWAVIIMCALLALAGIYFLRI